MSIAKHRGEDARSPERPELRRRIEELFPTVDDLNAFVADYFNDVRRQYSAEMTRIQRVNLLLEKETPEKVAKCLRGFQKEKKSAPPPLPLAHEWVSPPVHIQVRLRLGTTPIELLDALDKWCRDHCEEAVRLEHRELQPEPTLNGWRRLALRLIGNAVVLEAFPALLDPCGSPEPKLRVQVARGTEAAYVYLPLGRVGREYRVFLYAGKKIRIALEPQDRPGRITFEIAEPLGAELEVPHEQ